MLINQALKQAIIHLKNISKTPSLDAEVLLSFVLKKDRAYLFAHLDKELTKTQHSRYKKLISRRKKCEPVAYITNHKEFYGLDFYVNKNVLIPRPETELAVETVLDIINVKKKRSNNLNIADVGTGSGCIAISLAKNLPKTKLHAADISNKALNIAKINAKNHKVLSRIKFYHGNLLSPISKKTKFDIIIANLPYLSEKQYKETKKDVKKYEPKSALVAQKQGMDLYIKLLNQIPNYIKKEGYILFEIDPSFENKIILEAVKILKINKNKIKRRPDLFGKDRVLIINYNKF
jgi:release factor glutamine methyltransferase